MYQLLLRLMVGAALIQLGLSWAEIRHCHSRVCLVKIEKAARQVTRIEWRSTSIWPEEAKRFR